MTPWHYARRITAAAVAGIVAAAVEAQGLPLTHAVLMGVAAAIVVAGLVFPLLFRRK